VCLLYVVMCDCYVVCTILYGGVVRAVVYIMRVADASDYLIYTPCSSPLSFPSLQGTLVRIGRIEKRSQSTSDHRPPTNVRIQCYNQKRYS
jgi:hypothetical protein